MKNLVVMFIFGLSLSLTAVEDLFCQSQILQVYGLGGLVQPTSYQNMLQQLNVNHCPGIEYTCCSFTDFKLTKNLWDQRSEDIKRYLTKMFRIIQKTTVLQGSLLQIASQIKGKNSKYCREVDSTFFNNPIHYDEIYYYLQNALDAFAFMQKGFYCTICDARNHKYLAVERGFTRKVAVVDVKFCNDLIFFFREFIMFKVYFIDPMIVNTNYLLNCHEETDKYKYDFEYMTTYQMIEGCVENGINCEFVCKEFRFGSASELFVGKIKKFYEFFKNIERVLIEFNPEVKEDINKEFEIDDTDYENQFFTDMHTLEDSENNNLLKDFNLSNFEINIENEGINMFDIANNSNYFLTNARTRSSVIKNFGLEVPGGSSLSTNSTIDSEIAEGTSSSMVNSEVIQTYKSEDNWERQYQQDKLSQDPHGPSKAEMTTLELERDQLEKQMAADIRLKGSADYDNGAGIENFGSFKNRRERRLSSDVGLGLM